MIFYGEVQNHLKERIMIFSVLLEVDCMYIHGTLLNVNKVGCNVVEKGIGW